MKLEMHSVHFDADSALIGLIQDRMNSLDELNDKIIHGKIILRLDKFSALNKVVEAQLTLEGKRIQTSQAAKTFENCMDLVVADLRSQILPLEKSNDFNQDIRLIVDPNNVSKQEILDLLIAINELYFALSGGDQLIIKEGRSGVLRGETNLELV
ncbi:MAG: hypothetical protein CMP48_19925 [Rickettsiales bacterium]|nr:hypothetical protein [Rickettsiales bacterium]